ncbi:MAG: glycoside hydrolase family 99-like domain-containing protein [Ruminococcus sp.]
MNVKKLLNQIFNKLPISEAMKHKAHVAWAEYKIDKEERQDQNTQIKIQQNEGIVNSYAEDVLSSYGKRMPEYCSFEQHKESASEYHLSAYYLTQFHPNPQNDEWWGKGTTEWNNVNQAVPQFVGHYQPRKPGELGYYDLRLKENMLRQIELARNYGIKEFCFYYYWFDGERLLERPLNMFLSNPDLQIEFSYCWANENWTKRFSGTDTGALMKITQSVESYSRFIDAVLEDMKDTRYHRINGKPILSVYRPSSMPEPETVIANWQRKAKLVLGTELYLIAVLEGENRTDWIKKGYNATTEFQPRSVEHQCVNITEKLKPLRKDFGGKIYDYADLVENRRYNTEKGRKCYPAVMPMWDNTARRNHRGTIFHGATPELYKRWLSDKLNTVAQDTSLDEKRIFINAWNEWGEGAYMEPDYAFGYAFLQATYEALSDTK